MVNKKKKFIKIAIDSPAAAGAGTVAKAISKHYKLFYLDSSFVEHLYRFSTKKMGKIRISWIYLKDAMFFSINKFGLLKSILFLIPLALITYIARIFFWMIRGQLSWKN